jgi:hypothetical protein
VPELFLVVQLSHHLHSWYTNATPVTLSHPS